MVRIIAGAARGRRLATPAGAEVRPTSDRAKEALFSSLQAVVADARVLDLYAGSGGLGLEALSRGALSVTFVERTGRALAVLRGNVEAVGLPGAEVVAADVRRALEGELPGVPFDLVLADPPYREGEDEVAEVLALLPRHLAPRSVVVIERDARAGVPRWPSQLLPVHARRYGATTLHRAELAVDEDPPGAV